MRRQTISTPRRPPRQQTTPVFGSGTAFGAGSGFAGFTGVPATATPAAEVSGGADGGEDDDGAAPEEECQAEYKPVVQLEEVETSTGEEDEEALVEL
jgi:Ran-binding protein 1